MRFAVALCQPTDQGLISPTDAAAFPAGVRAAVFPPILRADSDCAQLPQPFASAPGRAFGGHHSYPGGLPVPESNNDLSDVNLASPSQSIRGHDGRDGTPRIDVDDDDRDDHRHRERRDGDLPIDADVIVAAPIWHDWAGSIVLQWNADDSEVTAFNFGGAGTLDAIHSEATLAERFGRSANGRTPDLIPQPIAGTIYGGSAAKIAEHRGFADDDTHVACCRGVTTGEGADPARPRCPPPPRCPRHTRWP